ncbi:iron ABC transporter substrate-binding protein [Microcella humidisoli]|uniref:Iron ABC transporter substrate-binding protein n=1 Tax=Microcella humidisoli TaxID=2963406 RepID=A0ABY5FZ85_9MICO|nr:iron ABC transporter substrate-binding protein [Microcella humidisoli]UTT63583.1 iron ABC transporter substrate-binding protein [Microcella humidisoli]
MRVSAPLSLTALAATGLLLAGCAAPVDSEQPTEPAADGAFTLYSGRDEELVQPLIDQFEAETGIEVEVRYGNTAELGALLLEEGDATPADVFLSQDAGALGALSQAGLFTTLPADVTDAVPAGFTSTDGSWVGVTGRARVVVFDGERLTADQLPDDIDDYVDPEWNGRVGVAPSNASFQSFVTALRVLDGEDDAAEWVSALAGNSPQIFEGNSAILTAVDEGVLEVGLINHYYWYGLAAEAGEENMRAQLKFLEAGDAGSIVNVTGAGILNGAATDADALEFVRYLVSLEAQTYFVEQTFEYPLLPGVDAPAGLPSLESLINPELDLSDLDDLATTQQLLADAGLI